MSTRAPCNLFAWAILMPFPPAFKALVKQFMKVFLHPATAVALSVLRVVSLARMLTETLTKVLPAWLLSALAVLLCRLLLLARPVVS